MVKTMLPIFQIASIGLLARLDQNSCFHATDSFHRVIMVKTMLPIFQIASIGLLARLDQNSCFHATDSFHRVIRVKTMLPIFLSCFSCDLFHTPRQQGYASKLGGIGLRSSVPLSI